MTQEQAGKGDEKQQPGAQPAQAQPGEPPAPGMVAVQGTDQEGKPTVDWVYSADLTGAETPAGQPGPGEGGAAAAAGQQAPQFAGTAGILRALQTPEGQQALAIINAAGATREEAARRAEATRQELSALVERSKAGGEEGEKAKVEIGERAIRQLEQGDQAAGLRSELEDEVWADVFGIFRDTEWMPELTEEEYLAILTPHQGSNAQYVRTVIDTLAGAKQRQLGQQGAAAATAAEAQANQQLAEKHTGAPGGQRPAAGSEEEKKIRAPLSAPGPATPEGAGQTVPVLPGQPVNMDQLFDTAAEQVRQG